MFGVTSEAAKFQHGLLHNVPQFMVICLFWLHRQQRLGVVAYEKLTGKVKWSTATLGEVGYDSPAIIKVGAESHVVMMTASTGRGESASEDKIMS
jgi:hypothetical protein